MPRPRHLASLALAALLLVGAPACGGSTGGVEEAADYLYSCPLEVTNGTLSQIVQFEWALVERRSSGDVVWDVQARSPHSLFDPGMTQTLVLGPDYADVSDPSTLEWRVGFTDASDVGYGPWILTLAECPEASITVTPADAN